MTALTQISQSQANRVVSMNEAIAALSPSAAFGINWSESIGLVYAYYGGTLLVDGVLTTIADGTVALSASTTNYIERTRAGAVSKNTTGYTAGATRIGRATTSATGLPVEGWIDDRAFVSIDAGIELPVVTGAKRFITHPGLTSLTDGTDTAPVNGTRYSCSLFVPYNTVVTGIGYLLGTVGGSNNVIVELKNGSGANVANSSLAGTLAGTLGTFQLVPFTAPLTILGPAWYFPLLQFNGATVRFRTIPANLGISQVAQTQSVAGTFGTLAPITPPTGFTPGVGPILFLY